jgi:hypothetical protein
MKSFHARATACAALRHAVPAGHRRAASKSAIANA